MVLIDWIIKWLKKRKLPAPLPGYGWIWVAEKRKYLMQKGYR